MPLSMLRIGEQGEIKRITGRDEHKRFLERLGFAVGEPVSIVSETTGNYIVNVKDVRVALDRTMANRIYV